MDKQWKTILALGGCVIAFSIAYYFLSFLPYEKKTEDLSKNKLSCSQLGDKTLVDYKNSMLALGSKLSGAESATNHYNQKLSKCIVEIFDSSYSGNTISNFITVSDAVENKNLLWCYIGVTQKDNTLCTDYSNNSEGVDITKAQFDDMEKKYMSE